MQKRRSEPQAHPRLRRGQALAYTTSIINTVVTPLYDIQHTRASYASCATFELTARDCNFVGRLGHGPFGIHFMLEDTITTVVNWRCQDEYNTVCTLHGNRPSTWGTRLARTGHSRLSTPIHVASSREEILRRCAIAAAAQTSCQGVWRHVLDNYEITRIHYHFV